MMHAYMFELITFIFYNMLLQGSPKLFFALTQHVIDKKSKR